MAISEQAQISLRPEKVRDSGRDFRSKTLNKGRPAFSMSRPKQFGIFCSCVRIAASMALTAKHGWVFSDAELKRLEKAGFRDFSVARKPD